MKQTKFKIFLSTYLVLILANGCAQTQENQEIQEIQEIPLKQEVKQEIPFTLKDYLIENKSLDEAVNKIFSSMDDTALVAQLLMPAAGRLGLPKDSIIKLINKRIIGGVLMLNGTKEDFTAWIKSFENLNKKIGNLPFLYSADAEPSLVNKKIIGSALVKKAAETSSIEEVKATSLSISKDLNDIGINYNFAPVVDVAGNATVGYRGFGSKPDQLKSWSIAFIENTQKLNIIATAKHFPGHGLVSGDTHKALQIINGEMLEVKNYPALIANGVLSIMIAHIAVQNNAKYDTKGLPSTLSENIVTKLLRDSLGFKGLIVTDAMNMGGVRSVPLSSSKAVRAGCDIVLMPADITKAHNELLNFYRKDPEFKKRVDESAKRVIRMKLALGLLNTN